MREACPPQQPPQPLALWAWIWVKEVTIVFCGMSTSTLRQVQSNGLHTSNHKQRIGEDTFNSRQLFQNILKLGERQAVSKLNFLAEELFRKYSSMSFIEFNY
jgi:hypothetical protein